ncbi:nuclear pore complex protein Nup50 isoform X1 [Eublepharis macularius]|uniref:Nuclear pore complex protein Nup50 n=1 Tax=Eublepharis macularius TaxID=481883 RepID=A0AA97KG93_EUBMA|nr:nuclear pore complex protein Nup50 isoform X1 [Eublepharis macularius]XP_054856433.1 nuclear pore complex protein Nup50 isoform X1 [Eublepharis macularius]XP_054856434.1 nuclear pore complex protein Nup50 isoform X1 [Eublepharis macularius]
MAKRVAEKELTDKNWDQEEETEEMGTFSVASEEVLKNRAIKKAKRRNVGLESESGGAFKGFKGFDLSSGGVGFSGFGNGTRTKPLGLSNGSSSITNTSSYISLKTAAETKTTLTSPVVSSVSVNTPVVEKKPANLETNGESQQPPSSGFAPSPACSSNVYHKQLAALNCSVRDWIVKHVNANPLCDLTPIFRDYEKYLAEIEQHGISSDSGSESESNKAVGSQPGGAFGSSNLQQGSIFFFNSNRSEDMPRKGMELEKKPEPKLGSKSAVTFTFSKSVDSSGLNSSALPSFSFSSGCANLFGKDASQGSAPSFSSKASDTQMESASNEDKGGEEEEEEPPKVVVNEIKEDDAFYSKKCKVFYKKDNEFKEKGVGTLHLKPAGNQKTQLLIRADTNLGNILLNILVPPKMPCSRTGKNNVLIVCIPNPPVDEKNAAVPVPMLIRVKTSEDADELHKILLEKKEA